MLRSLPTVPSTYLPPLTPRTVTTTRAPTTTTRRIVTTAPTPKIKLFDEVEVKEGYNYPTPKIAFPLPPRPTEKIILKVETPRPTVPVTYLPPVISTTPRTTTRFLKT